VDELIFGDADRLVGVAKRVLGDHPVLGLAEQEADRRAVAVGAELGVDRAQVEVELAGMLGPEVAGLELDDDVAAEVGVVEQQVEVEVLTADLEMDLAADEREAGSELEQEGERWLMSACSTSRSCASWPRPRKSKR
jgi:hypothetical protein